MTDRPLIVVTPGDPDGVGPEICWKAACATRARLLFVGAAKPFEDLGATIISVTPKELKAGTRYPDRKSPFIWLVEAPARAPKKSLLLPGYQSGWSIKIATRLIQEGSAHALVTGPISKERLHRGGFAYPGHTEFLADLCKPSRGKAPPVTMMLANDFLRVSLVTTHVAFNKVSSSLTRPLIRRAVLHTVDYLRKWWRIQTPRVAVAALNPHAGEAGLFGEEEIKTISPEVRFLQKRYSAAPSGSRAEIQGPLPADTLFAKNQMASPSKKFDAVVCMYHDQGLIPVKLLDFRNTVNVTLGLPIVRTSVDHGVGFDIAKTGKADPSSLQSAIDLAHKIIEV